MKQLEEQGVRCELDSRNEKIGFKIREARLDRVPYMIIIGNQEKESGTISVRSREDGETTVMTQEEFVELVRKSE